MRVPNCHNSPMPRVLLILLMFLLPLVADAKRGAEVRRHGDMTAEELRREPVALETDVPYAGTGNPQHRLDIYLPRKRVQ